MIHWLLIWIRNWLVGLLALSLAVAYSGAFAVVSIRYVRGRVGMTIAALGSLALLMLIATHPTLKALFERMAAEERSLKRRDSSS